MIGVLLVVGLLCFSIFITLMVTESVTDRRWQRQAIAFGFGTYTREGRFVWKVPYKEDVDVEEQEEADQGDSEE